MEKRYKYEFGVLSIIGAVFTFIGAIFLILGIALFFTLRNESSRGDALIFLAAFGGIGLVFFVLGIIFLCHEIKKNKTRRELLARGYYIYAEVTDVFQNRSIRINNRYPYSIQCTYQDPATGQYHIFTGGMLMYNPESMLRGKQVPVYIEPGIYDNYYVDIYSVLPQVQDHSHLL